MLSDKVKLFELANERLIQDREFMAFYLKEYINIERIDKDKLCIELNCSFESYLKLSLCKAPKTGSGDFINRLNQISEYTGVSVLGINNIIKRVDAIISLSNHRSENYLMAARDKGNNKQRGNS